MLVMIDGPMINRFIDDVETFRQCAEQRFQTLDTDGDGLLSRSDIHTSIPASISSDDYHQPTSSPIQSRDNSKYEVLTSDQIFDRFDVDGNGGIDKEEFRPMLMEILIALARGIGAGVPVNFGVGEGSLLLKVYEHDSTRIERQLLEKKRKEEEQPAVKECSEQRIRDEVGSNSPDHNAVKVDGRKLRKKKSKKLFGICACSTKYLGGNGTLD